VPAVRAWIKPRISRVVRANGPDGAGPSRSVIARKFFLIRIMRHGIRPEIGRTNRNAQKKRGDLATAA